MNKKRYSDLVADFKQLFSVVGALNDPPLRGDLMAFLAQWLATVEKTEWLTKDAFMRDVSSIKPPEGLAESLDPLLSKMVEVVRLRNPGASETLKNAFEESKELQESAFRYLVAEMLYCDGSVNEFYREKRKQAFLDCLVTTNAHRYQAEAPVVHAIQSLARQIADERLSSAVKEAINAD